MSTLMQWTEQGQIREMSENGRKPRGECTPVDGIRFLAGSGVTDAGGQWQLTVADASCEPIGLVHAVSFVATTTFNPLIDVITPPSVVTTAHTASGGNVTLYARTWDCACKAKPNTPFDYHVAIAYVFVQ